jgi:hypothetical protein
LHLRISACDEVFCGWPQKKHAILGFQMLNCKGGVAIKGFGLQLKMSACNEVFCGWQQKKTCEILNYKLQILNCKGGVAIKGFGLQ